LKSIATVAPRLSPTRHSDQRNTGHEEPEKAPNIDLFLQIQHLGFCSPVATPLHGNDLALE
jgi:hypothetical protein